MMMGCIVILLAYCLLTIYVKFMCCDFNVGGLFNDISSSSTSDGDKKEEGKINIEELAFRHALSMASIEYEMGDDGMKPIYHNYAQEGNSFETKKLVCDMFGKGIGAVFGPQLQDSAYIVQSVCDAKEIPNFQMRWDLTRSESSCLVNVYPYPDTLSKVYSELVHHWQWKEFTVIYENNESIIRIAELLKPENNHKAVVKLRQLRGTNNNFRRMLRGIKDEGIRNMVLDCSIEILPEVLKQAQQVGLMGFEHNFIITNLNLHTLDLEPYQYSGANITGFSLLTTRQDILTDTVNNLSEFAYSNNITRNFTENELTVEAALIYDAVKLYSRAVNLYSPQVIETPCDSYITSGFGFTITNSVKMSTLDGLTGLVGFDHRGFRSEFDLQIMELTYEGVQMTGTWNKGGLQIYRAAEEIDTTADIRDLRNMTFTIVISLTDPYGMRKKSPVQLLGNEQYEGYCVDLIRELSDLSGFKYNFIVQDDGQSGDPYLLPNGAKKWTGMIGAVIDGVADLALADTTITREREKDVDFASPYMDLGIAVLYKKPKEEPAGFFSFLDPFHVEVWIYVIAAYIFVSLMFFVMGRISPYEWRNPFPCIQEPEELENQFTLLNSFFFTIGALMQQGSDIAPVSMSTRLAAGFWWFFTLIMVSCYTANLAAFLSVENPSSEINSVEDLANQDYIKYGAKRNGATFKFFRDSKKPIYKRMYNYMAANPEVLTTSSKAGVERAENEEYAFLMESTSIEYEVERRCNLQQVGKLLDSKGYGIVMRKGSWYLNKFSQLILHLQEKGTLAQLKRKWWNEKYSGSCQKSETNEAETLGIANVGGVFIVLIAGIIISIPIAFIELLIFVWDACKEENISFTERIIWEIKFILRCHGSTKPAKMDSSGSGTNENNSSNNTSGTNRF